MHIKDYYLNILNFLKKLIFSLNVNLALDIAELYGFLNTLNFAGIYKDDEIEDFLFSNINKKVTKDIKSPNFSKIEKITFIVSELYEYGGHTKALINWIKCSEKGYRYKVVITRQIPYKIEELLNKYGVNIYKCKKQYTEKVKEIVINSINSKYVIAFIHPEDIIAAIAIKILKELGHFIIFYNHADHTFSYGLTSSDVVCEISKFGIELNRRKCRMGDKHIYLGIPIFVKERIDFMSIVKRYKDIKNKKIKTILSVGSPWKYEPFRNISFDTFIDSLLSLRKDIRFILVGPTGKEDYWKKVNSKWKSFVTFTGLLTYNQLTNLLNDVDIYIDSFPIPGGTTFPEILSHGIPAVGLDTPFKGYYCANKLHFKNIETLINVVNNLLSSQMEYIDIIIENINNIKKYNSYKSFCERAKNLYLQNLSNIPTDVPCGRYYKSINTNFLEKIWEEKGKIKILLNFIKNNILRKLIFYKIITNEVIFNDS